MYSRLDEQPVDHPLPHRIELTRRLDHVSTSPIKSGSQAVCICNNKRDKEEVIHLYLFSSLFPESHATSNFGQVREFWSCLEQSFYGVAVTFIY